MCLYVILYSNWCSKDFLNLWINIFQHLILFSVLISPYRASGMCLLLLLRFQIYIGHPTLIYPFQISSLFSILLSLHALSRMLSSGQFSSSLSLSSTRSYDNIRSCTWQYLIISIWYLIFSLSTLYLYLNFKGCLLYSSTILSIVTPPLVSWSLAVQTVAVARGSLWFSPPFSVLGVRATPDLLWPVEPGGSDAAWTLSLHLHMSHPHAGNPLATVRVIWSDWWRMRGHVEKGPGMWALPLTLSSWRGFQTWRKAQQRTSESGWDQANCHLRSSWPVGLNKPVLVLSLGVWDGLLYISLFKFSTIKKNL